MSVVRSCDICFGGKDVSRYSLTRKVRYEDGTLHSCSMGGVDLCIACWTRESLPRMRGSHIPYPHPIQECTRCGSEPARTFSLKVSRRVNGKVVDRAKGGITLCLQCWEATAKSSVRRERDLDLAQRIFRGEA
jgi:hypothetical protein